MRIRTEQWSKIAARGNFTMETKARIGGIDYTAISAPRINRVLMQNPLQVGNCASATLDLSIMTDDNISSSTPIVILGRLTNGKIFSEWKEFGTFYINQRDTSFEGLLTIKCFDSMLKTSQDFITEFETEVSYPRPMIDVVVEIANRTGVGIDPRTKINTGSDYVITYPSGRTMSEVLGFIGACHGGNWIITEDNLLRLVPLVTSPDETFHIIGDNFEKIKTVEDDQLIYKQQTSYNAVLPSVSGETPSSAIPITHYITDEYGAKIVTSDGHILTWAEDGSVDATDGIINIPVVCGEIDTGKPVIVSCISMSDDAGNTFTTGNKNGTTLRIESNPYATQQICDNLFMSFNGLVFLPFSATKAAFDPATELGDMVVIGDKVRSVLCCQNSIFDLNFRADISAPDNEEMKEEYPFLTETKKTEVQINKIKEQNEINFQIASDRITAEVSRATAAEGSLSSRITQNAESITTEVSRSKDAENSLSSRITQNAESITTEVSRATTAEKSLTSRITQNAESITTEVSRATAAEGSLSSRITQNANSINLKVDSGNVSSELSLENGNVTIESNRLKITSTNFTLQRNGDVVANNIQAEGSLTSSNSSSDTKTKITDGAIKFYEGSTLAGRLASDATATGGGDISHPVVDLETNSDGIIFSVGSTYYVALNNGLNTGSHIERFLILCDSRFRDQVHLSSSLIFDAGNPDGGNTNTLFLSDGTICTDGNAYVGGDFRVIGTKNRIVETTNFGTLSLNAMESTSAVFSDLGSGLLDETGICEVFFDVKFSETIDSFADYLVFITQTSEGRISYTEKQRNCFSVTGEPGTRFDWIVFAKQKNYATTYLDSVNVPQFSEKISDDSAFMGDSNACINSEDYMNDFSDDLDEQAQIYLDQYEREVLCFDY